MSPELSVPTDWEKPFEQIIELAGRFAGLTSPNPCVGAAALTASGHVLSIQAHERAGEAHAEAKVLRDLESRGLEKEAHTLLVTLEPCNHAGRTPPCTKAIANAGIRRVIYGATDPNPRVPGRGAEVLRSAGIEALGPQELLKANAQTKIPERCELLIRSFAHWAETGRPWVCVKTAVNLEGNMIPPPGRKTFTSDSSLRLAHALRKRADAVLTGSGTILADQPQFTVRHVPDHPGKSRWLAILDRRGRVSTSYLSQARLNGFQIHIGSDLSETLRFLGSKDVLEVLVEAGPTLTQTLLEGGFWNEHVLIQQEPGAEDQVEIRLRSR